MPRVGLFEQILDDNGDPLANGRLYWYEVGTTTPKTVYSDSGESVPYTPPVVLDSAGRMPDVFYTGDARLVINDSADAEVWAIAAIGAEETTAARIRELYLENENTNAFTDAEQTKLAGLATDANNYVHPNHTGDVTSIADGATTLQPNAIIGKEQIETIADTDEYLVSDAGVLKRVDHSVIFDGILDWDYSGLTASGEYTGIEQEVYVSSGFVNAGRVYVRGSAGGTGTDTEVVLCDPRFESTAHAFCLSLESTSSPVTTTMLKKGFVYFPSLIWTWTPGDAVYATTGGALTATRPATGYAVRVGVAMTPRILYFDPQDPVDV